MEVMNEWEAIGEKRGEERGRRLGRLEVLLEDLRDRFSRIPRKVRARLEALSLDQLREIKQSLPGFRTVSDVDRWIDEHC